MKLQNVEIENSKDAFDYEITANFENFFVKCFIDVESHEEEHQQTTEEIEMNGVETYDVIDNVEFWLFEAFDNDEKKISISEEDEKEIKYQIENLINQFI